MWQEDYPEVLAGFKLSYIIKQVHIYIYIYINYRWLFLIIKNNYHQVDTISCKSYCIYKIIYILNKKKMNRRLLIGRLRDSIKLST